MWKAILILYMTSGMTQDSILIAEYAETFIKEAQCQKFIVGRDMNELVGAIETTATNKFTVLDHYFTCIQDTSGRAV